MSATALGVAGNIEKQMPVTPLGNFLAFQVSFIKQIQPQGNPRSGSMGFTRSTSGAMLLTKEYNSICNNIKFGLTAKAKPDWNKAVAAIKRRSYADFVSALLPGLEFTGKSKKGFKFPFGVLNLQGGVDFKHLPIIFRGFYKPKLQPPGVSWQYVIVLNVGPSVQGWAWLAQRVTPQVLRQFLASNGTGVFTRMSAFLASRGIFFMGATTAAVSFGLFSLLALYASYRARQGELVSLSSHYVSGYKAKLFHEGLHGNVESLKLSFTRHDKVLRNKLIDAGAADAVRDARNYVKSNKIALEDPNEVLEIISRYINGLNKKYKTTSVEATKRALDPDLYKRAKKALNG